MSRIGDQRKREILTAAAACFARKGFHQTSVQDICAAAGMSPGSVYRWFRSKDEIIRRMAEEQCEQSSAFVESVADRDDFLAALDDAFGAFMASLTAPATNAMYAEVTAEALRNPEIATIVRASDAAILPRLADIVARAQMRGSVEPSLDPLATAEILAALFDGLWWRQTLLPEADPARHLPTVSRLLARLLSPDPGP